MERVNLLDECTFATGGGLWTGKKGTLVTATVIRNTNFTASGRVDYSDVAELQVEEKQLASRRLAPGDIIIERSGGGPSQPVGRVVFFERDDGIFSHSNFTSRLRVIDTNRFEPRFVFYFLLYFHDSGQTDHLQRRTTGIRNLDWRAYRESVGIPLFKLDEQRQIAAVLSAVQRAIERQERLIALTAELKKALMHKLFTEGTRGERLKQTEIGPVPASWEIVRLDQIATIERGKFAHRPRNAPEFYGGDIPFVQTGDVSKCDGRIRRYTQTLNERGLAISRMFPRGTILITIAANIGYTGILEFDSACTDSLVAITPARGDSAEFLNHYLQTQQPVMDRLAPQGTQKNINIQFLKPWPIPRPSLEEQEGIANALSRVDAKRRTHERMGDSLNSLFRTLLHQLMTAQIRVHDLDLSSLEEADKATREARSP
jgi:type I restriction enzyme S subunit